MDHNVFANDVSNAVLQAFRDFCTEKPEEQPYAFAIIGGQEGNYIGFAVATHERLRITAKRYHREGYQYQAHEWETFDNVERLSVWLRWANPDDGWFYGDFKDSTTLSATLRRLFASGELADSNGSFEAFCTDKILAPLGLKPDWISELQPVPIIGFTYGEDSRDFVRSATRCNPYPQVLRLWQEVWEADELDHRISKP